MLSTHRQLAVGSDRVATANRTQPFPSHALQDSTHWRRRRCRAASHQRVEPTVQQEQSAVKPGHSSPQKALSEIPDFHHPVDAEEFRKLGYAIVDWIADYYKELHTVRVRPDVQPGFLRPQLPPAAPEKGEPFSDILKDFTKVLMPGVVHWQSPKFFAYFPSNNSFPGMLADMLIGATNMIGFSWAASPVSTELEMVMMDWLAQLMGLPSKFMFRSGGPGGGVIQGTSSEAVLVALLAARAQSLRGRPPEDTLKLVTYASDQAHSAYQKACMIAGIKHVRVLPARAEEDFALQPEVLEEAIAKDLAAGLIPCFVLSTIGTTSSCAVDPVGPLAVVARKHGAWSHVDAAYAGSAGVCPDQRGLWFKGLEEVDSYSFNPHKWLLTNFDCCAMWASDAGPIKEALSLTPVFLQGTGNALDYKDWQIPLGRRWRSLKLFFVLRTYGAEKLREYVRHHIALAQAFAALVAADSRFELAAPPRFGLVCFRLRGAPREQQEALLSAINARGDMFLIHTVLAGQYTLRLAIGSTSTQARHVGEAWQAISAAADQVLGASASHPAAATDTGKNGKQ